MYKAVCVFLLLPFLVAGEVSPALAQWGAVERLAAGERIEVQLLDFKMLKGTLDHVTSDAVYVRSGSKVVEAQRGDVAAVSRRKSGHGGRWALIGGVAGAAALGIAGGTTIENKGGSDFAGAAAGLTGLGATIGAGIG